MSEEIDDYKAQVEKQMTARLQWERDLVFTASTQRGYDLEFDAQSQWGCMPLESLLMSIAGCMAIDVVAILKKMRCEVSSFAMNIEGVRSETPPQRLRAVTLDIEIAGEGLTDKKIARAVQLSEDKYCSVRHSLREDIAIETKVRVVESKSEAS